MNLDTCLALHGTDLAKITAAVDAEVGLQEDDLLFASGSLTTGLGNCHSDLDLFLITRRDLSAKADFDQAITFRLGGLQVDLEFVAPSYIVDLVDRLRACHASVVAGEERKSLNIPPRTLDFLHRVQTGRAMAGHARFNALRDSFEAGHLRAMIVGRSAVIASSEQEDFVGYLQENDFDSARFAGSRMLDAAIDACLAALGNTMVKEKWRMRLVERLATPSWDADFPGGPLLPSLREAYLQLHYWPRGNVDVEAHACSLVNFVNRCIPWAQRRVYGLRTTKPMQRLPLEREMGESLPRLASHVALRYSQRELIAFSHSRPAVIELNESAHDALACFDGRTSPSALAVRIASSTAPAMPLSVARRSVDHLAQVLFAAGFLDMAV